MTVICRAEAAAYWLVVMMVRGRVVMTFGLGRNRPTQRHSVRHSQLRNQCFPCQRLSSTVFTMPARFTSSCSIYPHRTTCKCALFTCCYCTDSKRSTDYTCGHEMMRGGEFNPNLNMSRITVFLETECVWFVTDVRKYDATKTWLL